MQHDPRPNGEQAPLTRRRFMQTTAALAAAPMAAELASREAPAAAPERAEEIRVGVIGCGGRGTGAAVNALEASPGTRIVSLADVFPERIESCRKHLASQDEALAARALVPEDRCFGGFEGYHELLAGGVDLVILATPPHFRPMHVEAAVRAGKHLFMEKPAAVDAPGVRRILAAADEADRRKLCIVAGTQRRHETGYREAMERIAPAGDASGGAIGEIVAAHVYWNQGGLWMHPRKPEWSDMEWQLRNWLYFTWLSGDHIVEQHVHNLDVVNWAMASSGGAHPLKAMGMGGRQVRTDPAYGHVFDHFAVEYEYPNGALVTSMCRQIDGCASRVEEVLIGTKGRAVLRPGFAEISAGGERWKFTAENNNPYVQEIADLIEAIERGRPVNEARSVAESTLTAIMGRLSAYTGKEVTWEQALNSTLDLSPREYAMGSLPTAEVAVPGKTPLV